jgi:hypothetical protein
VPRADGDATVPKLSEAATLVRRSLRYLRALLERNRKGARLVAAWREVRSLRHRRRMKAWLVDSPEAKGLDEPREIVADPREVWERAETSSVGAAICVSVGRSGELVLMSGTGELNAAISAGLDAVPMTVVARDPEWDQLRRGLWAYAALDGGTLYQPALHPDLAAVPAALPCQDRWTMLEPIARSRPGRMLDLGANLGYFDHRFERLGWTCTAVESDPILARFLTSIRDARGLRFEVVNDSFVSGCLEGRRYDLVLALSIFHHFLQTRQDFISLERFLRRLDADEMVLEPPRTDETLSRRPYITMDPFGLAQLVAEWMDMTDITCLGQAPATGRHVYRLSRASSVGARLVTAA